ncbi:fluoride efflux transporter CrcB [Cerasibacillus terrae]|uniref:Fluoride-specific ion channel FluC n=1 Tax=Cerasibacillus terrae TaxID=2498845 RepID=A0A5C8NX35_9BACI|nr:fluoride efflux transporter CrcB [Cerasibacillus terrae]TXL65704.1 fluoride efflux transporter CrcB [Cerasibacillus terrae]
MVYLYIGIAGCIGAILRYFISFGLSEQGTIFPYSTLMVNLLGSYLLAFLTTRVFTAFPIPVNYQMAIGTGLIGSFTTFSTLSVETVELFRSNHIGLGVIYMLISLFGGLFMSSLGFTKMSVEE